MQVTRFYGTEYYTRWLRKVSCCTVIDIQTLYNSPDVIHVYSFVNGPGLESWQHWIYLFCTVVYISKAKQ